MPGLLAFHAHPDDEVTSTGGVLAKYSEWGEQVVVVTATDGAEGEIHNYENPDDLRPRLVEMRAEEIARPWPSWACPTITSSGSGIRE